MKKGFLLFLVLCLLAFISCEENELKLPAHVDMEFDMKVVNMDNNSKTGQFTIEEGFMALNSFEFDGKREQGEDYYFSRSFDDIIEAELHTGLTSGKVSFDVPQGVYNKIDLIISLGSDEKPSLSLRGSFNKGPLENINVLFEYSLSEEIFIRAENKAGNRQVVLKKDQPSMATLLLDTPFMFQLMNLGTLRNAEVYMHEGQETIIISKEKNPEIFNVLVTRLDKSLKVIFE